MTIHNKNGKVIFEIDDFTLILIGCIIAFITLGHC